MVLGVQELLGQSPVSPDLATYVDTLSSSFSPTPEIKSYSDVVYFNYFSLGLSFVFTPTNGYRPKSGLSRSQLEDKNLVLDSIDLYNPIPSTKPSKTSFSAYSNLPIKLKLAPTNDAKRLHAISVTADTSGKDFVEWLGEPDRKGGGTGPSSGSISIWCEWSKDGVLVEFGGDDARGPQAWERGKDASWKVVTLFRPKI